jgi:exodeoxyribonuclease V alpha subunit
MDTFALAYALTVHKSQGSSYPVCIFIMSPNHGHMLQRNLYYTAVTRAEKRVILFTDQISSSFAIKNATARSRDTHLIDIL